MGKELRPRSDTGEPGQPPSMAVGSPSRSTGSFCVLLLLLISKYLNGIGSDGRWGLDHPQPGQGRAAQPELRN